MKQCYSHEGETIQMKHCNWTERWTFKWNNVNHTKEKPFKWINVIEMKDKYSNETMLLKGKINIQMKQCNWNER